MAINQASLVASVLEVASSCLPMLLNGLQVASVADAAEWSSSCFCCMFVFDVNHGRTSMSLL